MTTKLKSIFIGGLLDVIKRAEYPGFSVRDHNSMWGSTFKKYKYADGESPAVALQQALRESGLIEDVKVYWLLTTVESEDSGCTTKDMHRMFRNLPFLNFKLYHESEQFVNCNYFEKNHLKFYIYEVTQK